MPEKIAVQLLGADWRAVLDRREASRLCHQGFRKHEAQHVIDFNELTSRDYIRIVHERQAPLPRLEPLVRRRARSGSLVAP